MSNQHRMPTHHPRIFGTRHMVASANYLAAQTGFEILEAGGNAIDAGVGAGIALGVLQCEYVHFGGVAPIMIYLAETGRDGLDQRAGAVAEAGLRRVVPGASGRPHPVQHQALRDPGRAGHLDHRAGTLRHHVIRRRRRRRDPIRPRRLRRAVDLGRDHWRKRRHDQPVAAERGDLFARWQAAGGGPAVLADRPGELNPIHGGSGESREGRPRRRFAAARDAFYRGDIARKIVAYHKENDGWIRADDLAEFHVDVETPLAVRFGDITVHGCRPWCQGPVLLQTLRILDGIDLRRWGITPQLTSTR